MLLKSDTFNDNNIKLLGSCVNRLGSCAASTGHWVVTMALSRHLCLFILITTQFTPAATRQKHIKLKPDDPNLAVGQTLSLYCTLSKSFIKNSHVNASSIVFTFRRRETTRIPGKFVMVLNRRVAVLTYPNINNRHSRKSVCCAIADMTEEIDCQYLHVGRLPYKPVVTDIRVGENLTFSWTVRKKNKLYNTYYKGFWKTSDMLEFKPCNDVVCCEHYNIDKLYTVMVIGSNVIGNVTSEEVHFHPRDYAQPSIAAVWTRPDNATCVTVSWNPPKRGKMFLYNITYTSRWGSASHTPVFKLNHSDDIRSSQICNLVSHTVYVFALRAKFAFVTQGKLEPYGLWSEPATRDQRTLTTIPARGAEVTKGGFHVTQVKGHARSVRVFWKPIPQIYQNGDIMGYKITYMSPPNISTNIVDPECTWATLELLNIDHFYHVFVDAKTSAGYNEQRLPGVIAVGGMAQMPAACTNFTVFGRNKTSIYFEWTLDPDMVGYTVYWCQSSQNDFTCVTELKWQTLPAKARNFSIDLSANDTYYKYLFGMSAETTHASSGIAWSTCVYEDGKDAVPPRIKIKERHSNSLKFLLEKPSCAESRSYITGYNVCYCRLNEKGNCVEKKIETYIPGNKATHHTLQGLLPEHKYRIDVRSVSPAGVSYAADLEAATTESTVLSATSFAFITAASVVALVFCIVGFGYVCQIPSRVLKWMKTMPIDVPRPNQNSLGKEKDLDVEASGYDKHLSDSGGNSTPLLLLHIPAYPCDDTRANPSVTSPLQDDHDSESEDDTGYAKTRLQVEPLMFNPIGSSHKTVASNNYEEIGSYSNDDNRQGVDTPNNLCDDCDVNNSEGDDGYCKAVVSHFQHIGDPNIVVSDADSDDDNVCGGAKRVMSATSGDTPSRDISNTDGSGSDNDDACGYSKVVTSVSDQCDTHGSSSDTNSICGYSKAVTSTTPGDITNRHVDDYASSGSDDEDDITGYAKIVTPSKP